MSAQLMAIECSCGSVLWGGAAVITASWNERHGPDGHRVLKARPALIDEVVEEVCGDA